MILGGLSKSDETSWLAWIFLYNRYIEKCKHCEDEIYTIPGLKPICDKCTAKGLK
jgi:hypothetical protein